MSWGSAPAFSLGVEEELFLVDAETLEVAPVFEQVVPEPDARLKPELFACIVESTTTVCPDAYEVLAELTRLRTELRERASAVLATAVAVGTHPFARGAEQRLVSLPRYERLRAELGAKARQLCEHLVGVATHRGRRLDDAGEELRLEASVRLGHDLLEHRRSLERLRVDEEELLLDPDRERRSAPPAHSGRTA